jgi:superfamily II DNA or RNA helicase
MNDPNIKTYLDINGYHVKKKYFKKSRIKRNKENLTLLPQRYDPYTDEERIAATYKVYKKNETEIIIPRYYGIQTFGKPDKEYYVHDTANLVFTKTLREKQQRVVNNCLEYIRKNGGGLLSVPCGFGKTVCAIYMAASLGLKTLVVVHKSFLLDQWVQRILEFLDISADRIGIIKQKKCKVIGKDIVIATIQTLARRDYEAYKDFGFVIYDEAHHVSARYYSKALMKLNCKYTLALTATPYRGDGLIKVMYWFCGGTIYREQIKINKHVVVKMINYKSKDKKFKLAQSWSKYKHRLAPNTCTTLTNICKIDNRNKVIIDIINKVRMVPDRKLLILSERIEHLEFLKKEIDKNLGNDIKSCFYIGKTSRNDRETAENEGDIIFASYSMAHEGLDIKHLNTVILASPKKDVVQSVGRIMRKVLIAGDVKPLIIDFADDIQVIENWTKKRYAYYKKCQYSISDYYCNEDEFMTHIEYSSNKEIKLEDGDYHHKNIHLHNLYNDRNKIFNNTMRKIKLFYKLSEEITKDLELDCIKYDNIEEKKILDYLEEIELKDDDFEYEIKKEFDGIIDLEKDIHRDDEHIIISKNKEKKNKENERNDDNIIQYNLFSGLPIEK